MDAGPGAVGDPVETALRTAWTDHVADRTEPFDELVARHREGHRRYHGLQHVAHVVTTVDELAGSVALSADQHTECIAAAFYHDAIYEPKASTNEIDSALLARRELSALAWPAARIDAVAAMIVGTESHTDPATTGAAVLFDADLAILGAEPGAYESYRRAVREEYGHVTDAAWRIGRPDVLRAFLARPRIYATEVGHHRWEAAARRNLTDEIRSLTA